MTGFLVGSYRPVQVVMTMKLPSIKPAIVAAFATIYIVWGSTYLALVLALQSFPPLLLMAARCLVGGTVLFVFARVMGDAAPSLRTWGLAIICGILFFVGCHGVLAYAQERVPSGLAAVLLATIPLWITLTQFILPRGKRPSLQAAAFLVPGLAGVGLIAWHGAASGGKQLSAGDAGLLLGASLSWAAATVISERYSGSSSASGLSGMELIAGGVALLIASLFRGELADPRIWTPSWASIAGWSWLTIAGTIIAFSAYVWLLKQVSPTIVATYTFVNPIVAMLLGFAVLGEKPTLWMLAGAALVVASVAGLLLGKSHSAAPLPRLSPARR